MLRGRHDDDGDDDDRVPLAIPLRGAAAAAAASASADPVPLTVLCGWLGAGKTTLLNRCVADLGQSGSKVAVIQNEFSDAGVEDANAVGAAGGAVFKDFIELANGCICCTVRNDFVTALEQLVKMNRFDFIILECSGLADPGELVSIFWVDSELEIGVKLDAIVTLVDAKHLPSNLSSSSPEARSIRRQIAYADRIVLNKLDLIEDSSISQLEASIRQLNKFSPILRSRFSDVDLDVIFNTNSFAPEAAEALMQSSSYCGCAHGDEVCTLVFGPFEQKFVDLDKLKHWLAEILWTNESGAEKDSNSASMLIYRMKGVLNVKNVPDVDEQHSGRFYLQAVRKLFEVVPGTPWVESDSPFSKLVIIGLRLDESRLSQGFHYCLAPQ